MSETMESCVHCGKDITAHHYRSLRCPGPKGTIYSAEARPTVPAPSQAAEPWSEYMAKHGREEYAREGALPLIDSVVAAPGQRFPVIERELKDGLGYLDLGKGEIVIHIHQTNAQKNQILLHEIMHLCAEKLKQGGICKRQPSEEFIQEFAGVVFTVMAASGLLTHVEPSEALEFAIPAQNSTKEKAE